jgi:hypothetical protein
MAEVIIGKEGENLEFPIDFEAEYAIITGRDDPFIPRNHGLLLLLYLGSPRRG